MLHAILYVLVDGAPIGSHGGREGSARGEAEGTGEVGLARVRGSGGRVLGMGALVVGALLAVQDLSTLL